MFFYVVTTLSTLVLPVRGAYSWDYFADNFAGDLAPIVVLFGEQVTKQFLSESTTFLDSIIFGVAPLGVITAVVSVIRVWGNASLKAFIGRAQEAHGIAEAELCSSTSRDVCELWSNGGISRVFGRPKILEYVYTKTNDFYPQGGAKPTCGIHEAKRFFLRESLKPGSTWREIEPKKSTKTSQESDEFAPHPNLSLNIGIRPFGKWWHVLFAVLGVSIQSGFFVYGAWATYFARHLWQDNKPPEKWAFPIAATGTALMVVGMALCAMLIERSTYERRFKKTNGAKDRKNESPSAQAVMFWLQPGGQTIGDQVFNAFSYWEPKGEYITSYQVDDSKFTRSGIRAYIFWPALLFTLIGFVHQFVGLRGLHASVTLYQLVATVIMAIVRALLRSKRLGRGENRLQGQLEHVEGHELDWNALQIERAFNDCLSMPQASFRRLWYIADLSPSQNPRVTFRDIRGTSWLSSEMQNGKGIVGFYRESDLSQARREIYCVESALNWIQAHEKQEIDGKDDGPNEGARILCYRTRLAYLTGDGNTELGQPWDTEIRQTAKSLRKAIQAAATHIFTRMKLVEDWKDVDALVWSSTCLLMDPRQSSDSDGDSSGQILPIHFLLSRVDGQWLIDPDQLEAVLGLWLWSRKSEDKYPDITDKVLYITDQNKKEELKANLRVWISQKLWIKEDPLAIISTPTPSSQNSATLSSPAQFFTSLSIPSRILRSRGVDHAGFGKPVMLSTRYSTGSQLQLMAQDIFVLFLSRIVHILQPLTNIEQESLKGGGTKMGLDIPLDEPFRWLRDPNLEALAEILVSNGLDSRETALVNIVPSFQQSGKLPTVETVARQLFATARAQRANGNHQECEAILHNLVDLGQHNMQASAIRALGELYRFTVRSKKASERDFGLRGFDTLCNMDGLSDESDQVRGYYNAVALYFQTKTSDQTSSTQATQEPKPLESESQNIRPFGLLLITDFDRKPSSQRQMQFLEWAIEHNFPELIEDLRYINQNLILSDKCGGNHTPLTWAIQKDSDMETFRSLLDWRSTKRGSDSEKNTLLLKIASSGQHKYAEVLLQAGADPNVHGSIGYALQTALDEHHYEVAQQLIKGGADVNAWDSNATNTAGWFNSPLHYVIEDSDEAVRMVDLLIAAGADVNAPASYGGTALKIASDCKNKKLVEMLLAAGAN